jgi:hypothetical protein
MSVLKVSIYIITSIAAGIAAILVIMSVSAFKTAIILYTDCFPMLSSDYNVWFMAILYTIGFYKFWNIIVN